MTELIWHKYEDEAPTKEGQYITATYLDEFGEKRFANIGICYYWKSGHFVDVETCDMLQHYYRKNGSNTEAESARRLLEPFGYHLDNSGFYDDIPSPEGRHTRIRDEYALYWAELPQMPDGLLNQNEYDAWVEEIE